MRIILSLAVLSALTLSVQGQAPQPSGSGDKAKAAPQGAAASGAPNTITMDVPAAAALPIGALPPETLMATIDGRKVTAGELQAMLKMLPPQVQQQAQADRRKFIEQYGLMVRLSEEAKKDKLDQKSPYKEQFEYMTMQFLAQSQISRKFEEFPVPQDDVKKAYESNKDKYAQAKVKVIYLQFSTAPVSQADSKGKPLMTEAEAKAKADDLVKQLRAGADFVKLVKEYSADARSAEKDGDFGFLHKADRIPDEIKNAVFAAKPGEIAGPVRQANGFYIFRVEESGTQPLEELSGTIQNELKDGKFREWLTGLQKSLDIKMENELPKGVQLVTPSPAAPRPSNSAAVPSK
jgi:parvulin-like peptidyl-prolyl isomerase